MIHEPLVAYFVALVCGVLAAIDFNDHALLPTSEVDDVGSNRLLADELMTSESPGAEPVPESCFCVGGGAPKVASARGFFQVSAAHCCNSPSPAALRAATSPRKRGEV